MKLTLTKTSIAGLAIVSILFIGLNLFHIDFQKKSKFSGQKLEEVLFFEIDTAKLNEAFLERLIIFEKLIQSTNVVTWNSNLWRYNVFKKKTETSLQRLLRLNIEPELARLVLEINELYQNVNVYTKKTINDIYLNKTISLAYQFAIVEVYSENYAKLTEQLTTRVVNFSQEVLGNHYADMSRTIPLMVIITIFGMIIFILLALAIFTNLRLVQALRDANALKDDFLAICSHDIKSPLSAAVIAADTLDSEEFEKMNSAQKFYIKTIKNATTRVIALVDNLLNISKLESGRFELNMKKINISNFIDGIAKDFDILAEKKNIRILCEKVEPRLTMFADNMSVGQVLGNLISNAVKFSDKGRKVIVRAKGVERDNVSYIEISVVDEGQGIPSEKIGSIFDKFVQVREKDRQQGAGFGLAICKMFCDRHGGKIWVESKYGKGSIFYFLIPVNDKKELSQAA